ncbi:ryncolin-1-like [Oculina patagonica]
MVLRKWIVFLTFLVLFNFMEETKLAMASACKARKSCAEHYRYGERISGVYTIDPDGAGAIAVYCDLTTPGWGWTVIQKRFDGSVDFYRNWADYKTGFGDLNGEFWLGLDKIHRLTKYRRYMLRVDLEDTAGRTAYAKYDMFAVTSERTKYQLGLGSYSGTAGDSLSGHRGHPFTTKDQDNDTWYSNCAVTFKGAWWYTHCHASNLNGKYHHGKHSSYADGVNWYTWKGYYYSAKRSEMKIRPA